MPSVRVFALPLLVCLALGLAAGAAHAQVPAAFSPSAAFLYVGCDKNQDNKGAGTATVSTFGTTASGTYAFIEATPSTTDYKGLSAFGTGRITVTGGTFLQLLADGNGVINLIGDHLQQSDVLQHDALDTPYFEITGTLQQAAVPFTAEWYAPSTGTLLFDGIPAVPGGAPVPEASTLVSFALLMLGGGWLAMKRRKAPA